VLVCATSLALADAAPAAPVASFVYSPTEPLTGEVITFTSTSTGGGSVTWDLDGDGACDDASGAVASRAFNTVGSHAVRLCVDVDLAIQRQDILVRNRFPIASFTFLPAAPVAREPITLTSTAVDPDGPIVAQEWDLDADGGFDDGLGETAGWVWPRSGIYPVALRVSDRDGAAALALAWVGVAPRPAGLLSPAPLVRVAGRPTERGAHLDVFAVTAPKGATVVIRCRGPGCPYKRKRFVAKGKRVLLRALRGRFVAGAVIEIFVSKPETTGKYTRLRIRAGQRPARVDRCLEPGTDDPMRCPSN
jgi:hypothetical protein